MNELRFAAAVLAVLTLFGLSIPGCRDAGSTDACFAWPSTSACPGKDTAVLYMGDSLTGCDSELVSIDSDGEAADETCCYAVTISDSNGCDQLL